MLMCVYCGADVPAVATAAGARTIAASAGPGPGSGSRMRPRPGMERQTSFIPCCYNMEKLLASEKQVMESASISRKTNCIPSPATTASSLAKAVAVIGIVAPVPTLVTPVIGVKLATAGTPTALPGHAC